MSSQPSIPPPPPLPPIDRQFLPVRKNRRRPAIVAVITVLIIVGAGAYFIVLPRMSIVGLPVPDSAPVPSADVRIWAWGCNITVKNSGYLTGNVSVKVTFHYDNGTAIKSFTGARNIGIAGHSSGIVKVEVLIPWQDAVQSILLNNRTWTAKL